MVLPEIIMPRGTAPRTSTATYFGKPNGAVETYRDRSSGRSAYSPWTALPTP